MNLPVQKTLSYPVTIPSTKKEITFRPFLIKEEKALLIAEQSEDINVMVETLKNVINSCTFNAINVETLATFDLEYLLSKIRSKSVGEVSDIEMSCSVCNEPTLIHLDISELNISYTDGHTKKIHLYDDVGVVMKYPTIDVLNRITKSDSELEISFDCIIESIDYIYDDTKLYYPADLEEAQIVEFLDGLTKQQFKSIEQFFETMPKIVIDASFDCPHCKAHNTRELEGIQNFL